MQNYETGFFVVLLRFAIVLLRIPALNADEIEKS
jgi:hypothetical protein